MAEPRAAGTVLIAMRDTETRAQLIAQLGAEGSSWHIAEDLDAIRRSVATVTASAAVVGLRYADGTGFEAIDIILRAAPACRVVVVSAHACVASAVLAMRLGAHDVLTRPVSPGQILHALQGGVGCPSGPGALPSLARVEREYIEYVLAHCAGNITQAARLLGLHRQSLQRKLRKYPERSAA